jgi:hypothetical protein
MSDFNYTRCICPSQFTEVAKTVVNGLKMLQIFGPPERLDANTTGGVYSFLSESGIVFTVYNNARTSTSNLNLQFDCGSWESEFVDVLVGCNDPYASQKIINFISALNQNFGAFKTVEAPTNTYFLGGRL